MSSRAVMKAAEDGLIARLPIVLSGCKHPPLRRQETTVPFYTDNTTPHSPLIRDVAQCVRVAVPLPFNGDEMRLMTAALALVVTTPVAAEMPKFPVSIPQECVVLAQREGVPTVIENKYQATKARIKLAAMSKADPLVRDCRAAVSRAQQAFKASDRNARTVVETAPPNVP